jgi:hypothetical protein
MLMKNRNIALEEFGYYVEFLLDFMEDYEDVMKVTRSAQYTPQPNDPLSQN